MARRKDFDSRLNAIVADHVNELVAALTKAVRQQVADEITTHFMGGANGARTAGKRRGRAKKKKILQCIAPNCTNPSKGPRFHYLCDKHWKAPRKDYEAWREARLEKARAAG